MRGDVAVADRRQEVLRGLEVRRPRHLLELALGQLREGQPVHPVQLLLQKVAALGHVLLAGLALEPFPDALASRGALDEGKPVSTRAVRGLGGEDLHDLAVLELVVQRDHAAVDLGAQAAVTDLGVHAIGEVDGCRAGRQVVHVAARREHEHLVLEEVDTHGVDEGFSVDDLLLPLHQQAQPGQLLVAGTLGAFLVGPVRGHPELGDPVHLEGSDLNFDGLPGVRDHRRVQ